MAKPFFLAKGLNTEPAHLAHQRPGSPAGARPPLFPSNQITQSLAGKYSSTAAATAATGGAPLRLAASSAAAVQRRRTSPSRGPSPRTGISNSAANPAPACSRPGKPSGRPPISSPRNTASSPRASAASAGSKATKSATACTWFPSSVNSVCPRSPPARCRSTASIARPRRRSAASNP